MVRFVFAFALVSSMFLAATAFSAQSNAPRASVQATRNGPVARLVELERRKNEWLRQRFGR